MRVHFISKALFERAVNDEDMSRIIGYFHTHPIIITEGKPDLDLIGLITEFNHKVDQFTCRGSGYVLLQIKKFKILFIPFQPFADSSSYIPTPAWLADKHAVINVKNYQDDQCFKWAILSTVYPASSHADRLSNYVPYENAIDCSSLIFPVHPKHFSLFERDNPSIALHCLTYDALSKSFTILYLSQFMHERVHKITLLLLDSPHTDNNYHYVWVKNLSRLVASGYTYNHTPVSYTHLTLPTIYSV